MSCRFAVSFNNNVATGTSYYFPMSDDADPTAATLYAGIKLINASAAVYLVSKDGTTEQSTNITSTWGTPLNQPMIVDIVFTAGSSVKCYVNGVLAATNSTRIPTGTTVIKSAIGVTNGATAGNQKMNAGAWIFKRDF